MRRVRHALTRQNAVCTESECSRSQRSLNSSSSKQEGLEKIGDGETGSKVAVSPSSPSREVKEETPRKKPRPKRLALSRTLTPPFAASYQKDFEPMNILEENIVELPSPDSSSNSTDSLPAILPRSRPLYQSEQRASDPHSQEPPLSPLVLQSLQVFHRRRSTPHSNSVSEVRRESEDKGAGSLYASNPSISTSAEKNTSSDRQQAQALKQNLLKTVLKTKPGPPNMQPLQQTLR